MTKNSSHKTYTKKICLKADYNINAKMKIVLPKVRKMIIDNSDKNALIHAIIEPDIPITPNASGIILR